MTTHQYPTPQDSGPTSPAERGERRAATTVSPEERRSATKVWVWQMVIMISVLIALDGTEVSAGMSIAVATLFAALPGILAYVFRQKSRRSNGSGHTDDPLGDNTI